ncbi:formyltransferase family protein [Aureimonas sp. N4]|uniref:formyltransferase family protein n=1 Tax=Aureimonas sp. N4 TaxID=1638165 RepID=UPI000785A450|nr:formyltransferase family protein [Aureimonas sp. N4]
MRFVIVGQKWFAGAVLELAVSHGEVLAVLSTAGSCRFAEKAAERGIPVARDMSDLERMMRGRVVDLLITAHATKFVPASVRTLATAAIGYHPSLLPRHRGARAVQATIAAGDAIAGGTVFHLTDGWDEGPVAFQDWCFVPPDATAADLWRDELAPLGLELLANAIRFYGQRHVLPALRQDERFATPC